MKKTISLLIAVVILYSFLAQSDDCTPSANSCEYYKCVENHLRCGNESYLIHFGYNNCQKYLKWQNYSSSDVQRWYPKIRYCLQQAVTNMLNNENGPKNCSELQTQAFASHVNCYLETGYCQLNALDKAQVIFQTGFDILNDNSIATGLEIEKQCEVKKK